MNNSKLVEPLSEYMPELGDAETPKTEEDELLPLKQSFSIDKDGKAVSKEIFDYFKAKYGVGEEGPQEIYRTMKKDCPDWKYEVTDKYDFECKDNEVRLALQIPITSEERLPNQILIFDQDAFCGQIALMNHKSTNIKKEEKVPSD